MKANRIKSMPWRVVLQISVVLLFSLLTAVPCRAADKETATKQATDAVNDSAQAVAKGITTLQERISENRLVNRTREETVAFVLMGVLVASVAGMFSKIRCSGAGMAGRLVLGLAGAFIGGMVVRVAEIDYEWGTVTMGYEELLFSLLGAVTLVAVSRLIQFQMKKRKSKS
jgi:uncharacterized membrane protein YeaQ/YmgE (transglycosylase-associated protein family)